MTNPWFRSLAVVMVVGSVSGCAAGARKVESSGAGVKATGVTVAEAIGAEAMPAITGAKAPGGKGTVAAATAVIHG